MIRILRGCNLRAGMMVSRCNELRCLRLSSTHQTDESLSVSDVSTDELSFPIPFARAKLGSFTQDEPQLGNQYKEDAVLQSILQRHIPKHIMDTVVEPDLTRFGDRVATEMLKLAFEMEQNEPYLEKYSAWGKLEDKLVTTPAWKKMHDISAEEGLVSKAYERKYGEFSRLYSMAKLYMNMASSGLYSCPLAMTDGAAKIIEGLDEPAASLLRSRAYDRLISRSPEKFWTSGQWMTEKRGGSDVAGGTETVAIPQSDGSYRLHGYKWFSSATDADMSFLLARTTDAQGNVVQGTRGLSLFYLELKKADGSLNNIEILKLKNKLGTRQLPTAELLLDGSVAYKVSEEGRGVRAITDMLMMTRIHNSLAASSSMRRMLNLCRDYSTRRTAFGDHLKNYPLHIQTLARLEVEARGALHLCLENARLLGRKDCGVATNDEELLLRILVPLSKLYSAKQALTVATEGLESFGGQGYIEDTGLPSILRDAQVLAIWEGTTNVLSLDILRAIAKSQGEVLKAFRTDIDKKMASVSNPALAVSAGKVTQAADSVLAFIQKNVSDPGTLQFAARDLAYSMCRTYTGALLIDHACSSVGTDQDVLVAQRWCEKDLSLVVTNSTSGHYDNGTSTQNFNLVYQGYHDKSRL